MQAHYSAPDQVAIFPQGQVSGLFSITDQPSKTARMSLVSRIRFSKPFRATASMAWPISRVDNTWFGSQRRSSGKSGLPSE